MSYSQGCSLHQHEAMTRSHDIDWLHNMEPITHTRSRVLFKLALVSVN